MNVEDDRQFIDTNVLVYAYDDHAAWKQSRAQDVLSGLWESGQGCLSIQVLQEFYTVVTRKIGGVLPSDRAAGIISDITQWRVHSPVAADVLAAIDLARRHQVSYWDAAVIVSAQRLGCRVLWSEDLQDGSVYGEVEVRNPFGGDRRVQEPEAAYAVATPAPPKARRR